MSDFQKFENSAEWREKLRNFLLKENKPQPRNFITETQRYSFDISEDLQTLINNAKAKKMNDNLKNDFADNKENETEKENQSENVKKLVLHDETIMNFDDQRHVKTEISDESFEAMEKMCDKTASDPESTLFYFLHTNQKQEVLNSLKLRVSECDPLKPGATDAESAALDRLLNDLRNEKQEQIAEESPLKGVEMTQIEDIEAPSRFWENTVLQTSPVKMVGLLRPSTIIECAENSDVSSTQASFQSATRAPLSEISSSCYETASDTASFDKERKYDGQDLHVSVNLIDLENTKKHPDEFKDNLIDFSYKVEVNETYNDSKKSCNINFIDLTTDELSNEDSNESEESVIEVLSEDEDGENKEAAGENQIPTIKFEAINMSAVDAENNLTTANANDDRDILSTSAVISENSMHFNDTLEEVEYMMKKGMEFMTQTGAIPKQSPFKPDPIPNKAIKKNSPASALSAKTYQVSAPKQNSATVVSASKLPQRFAIEMKPAPKFELFKKPVSASKQSISTMRTSNKLANNNTKRFAHVISPISAYIKKTPEAPLMNTVKTKSKDMNSSVFRELEFESRKYQPQFKISNGLGVANLPKSPRSLPKKAYISSEYRQVVDERNPVTIPGGKSIQKYLGNVVLPAVIQHDGKANMPGNSLEASKSGRFVEENGISKQIDLKNDSYANLSVITGDVSLYTIKDAQKF